MAPRPVCTQSHQNALNARVIVAHWLSESGTALVVIKMRRGWAKTPRPSSQQPNRPFAKSCLSAIVQAKTRSGGLDLESLGFPACHEERPNAELWIIAPRSLVALSGTGQVNWKRGLFRVWMLLSAGWIMGWAIYLMLEGAHGSLNSRGDLIEVPILLFAPPIALWLFGLCGGMGDPRLR